MNKSKINPEDITLLKRLFQLEGEVIIFDPKDTLEQADFFIAKDIATLLKNAGQKEVCINLSNKALELVPFDFILEFNASDRKYKSFFREEFLTIHNPDGSIRWFLPETSEQPNFLALYNGSGMKAAGFHFAAHLAFGLGLKRWFCKGSFSLYAKGQDYFQQKFETKELAFFTGTVGENRKAVAALCKDKKATHFIKIPISEKAQKLIKKENRHLKEINKFDLETVTIPSGEMVETGLKLTNVCPKETLSSINIADVHLNGLKNLYASSAKVKMFEDIRPFQEVEKRLESIKRLKKENVGNISERKVERLSYNIKVLYNSFDGRELVGVTYAHGDFTPWNMFVSQNGIHVYDWELAMPEQLFLYDVFHFIFQSSILILRQPHKQILQKIENLENNLIVEDILERYNQDFWNCFRWYLVDNCSYYLELYMNQENLHDQATWLIDCWIEATNHMIKSTKQNEILVS